MEGIPQEADVEWTVIVVLAHQVGMKLDFPQLAQKQNWQVLQAQKMYIVFH